MSLRRKIALWLCPELGEARVEYYPSAHELAHDALGNAEAAQDTAWKEEVLEQLKALNCGISKPPEGQRMAAVNCARKIL